MINSLFHLDFDPARIKTTFQYINLSGNFQNFYAMQDNMINGCHSCLGK